MSYLALVSITPLGKDESVSKYVAKAFDVIRKSGMDYQLTAMGTIIEAQTLEQLMNVIQSAIKVVEEENNRVSVIIKLDCRKNQDNRIKRKVESVFEKLQ